MLKRATILLFAIILSFSTISSSFASATTKANDSEEPKIKVEDGKVTLKETFEEDGVSYQIDIETVDGISSGTVWIDGEEMEVYYDSNNHEMLINNEDESELLEELTSYVEVEDSSIITPYVVEPGAGFWPSSYTYIGKITGQINPFNGASAFFASILAAIPIAAKGKYKLAASVVAVSNLVAAMITIDQLTWWYTVENYKGKYKDKNGVTSTAFKHKLKVYKNSARTDLRYTRELFTYGF
ncbi:hypothetical protein ACUXCC_000915 [Cytobacillus horneckiae]|uniref:hypothetical protein n=1 Tax=Cytobacillus horneckiae TaxID=549687 RepID=UPI0019D28DF4|nr:hypothetical protein [Cytobacillus horneckiae]MBN6886257.1 hypothetical protein [Cytobacillus horneckiae]